MKGAKMAKEIALTKIAKISQAQQYMILSVLGASLLLGVAISLTKHFAEQISYNSKVIAEEEKSIASYSDVIKKTGICTKPSGAVYSDDELNKCDPDSIEISQIPGTLRYNILEDLAADPALNSVPQSNNTNCINSNTGKSYTYKELNSEYKKAGNPYDRQLALQKIKTCSALRVIPDALPAYKNEEALLASMNQIFNLSDWTPESISPAKNYSSDSSKAKSNINPIGVNISIEADTGTTMRVLHNIERSIREFDINRATIEWKGDNALNLNAQAAAYYTNESTVTETSKTIKLGGK